MHSRAPAPGSFQTSSQIQDPWQGWLNLNTRIGRISKLAPLNFIQIYLNGLSRIFSWDTCASRFVEDHRPLLEMSLCRDHSIVLPWMADQPIDSVYIISGPGRFICFKSKMTSTSQSNEIMNIFWSWNFGRVIHKYLRTFCRLNICIAFQYWARFWSHFDKATTCHAPNTPKYWDFKWWREVRELFEVIGIM